MKVQTTDGTVHSFIKFYCEYFLKENIGNVNIIENIVQLRQILKEIKEARLLKFMQESSIQRVHDDLDRAFYRTLSELRKHQLWRQERNTVDVTSEDWAINFLHKNTHHRWVFFCPKFRKSNFCKTD